MKITTSLVICSFTSWAAGAPLFLFLKNLPSQPGSLDSTGPSRSYSPDGSRVTPTKERTGLLDRLSDTPVQRLGNTISSSHQMPTSELLVDDVHTLSEEPAEPTDQPKLPATIVELEMGGLTRHVYLPCQSHKSTLHYYHVRKYADLAVFGILASFITILLLLEIWGPICERVRQYRSGEGSIRLEGGEGEKAKPNRQRKECVSCPLFIPRPTSKAEPVLSPIAEKLGKL